MTSTTQTKNSYILKIAIFATGFSGIVAEYLLSTLASYFLGDSILQWTLIVSLMLFSMGLGSRLSKSFTHDLLYTFLWIEFILSLVVSFAPLLVYGIVAYSSFLPFIIYAFAIGIGFLIGMEIPLVIRINEEYESLRSNISNILEKDYYGSLLGGVFFAFVGLPYLGLSHTPFLLGFVNFMTAFFVFLKLKNLGKKKQMSHLYIGATFVFLSLSLGLFFSKPIIQYGEQKKYKDKVIYTQQTKYQRIVMTQWKDNYWLYLNGNEQLSTVDEFMYHEPLVHPALSLHPNPQHVLILGGGDGCAVREILKYKAVKQITLVDLDPEMTALAKEHPILTSLNDSAFFDPRVKIFNDDGFRFLEKTHSFFDVIIIDLPDPRSVELGRLYSQELYSICYQQLRPQGILITQAGSPYFATKAFRCVVKTMEAAGFTTVPMHNHILTLGEWGWSLGVKTKGDVLTKLQSLSFKNIETQWITGDAMYLLTSFGKDAFIDIKDTVKVNHINDPVLYRYYLKGNWDLY